MYYIRILDIVQLKIICIGLEYLISYIYVQNLFRSNYKKNINKNVQWMQFTNYLALNNSWRVSMPSISKCCNSQWGWPANHWATAKHLREISVSLWLTSWYTTFNYLVSTPIGQLRSLLEKYAREKYEILFRPYSGLNNTTNVLQEWFRHQIPSEGLSDIKQRNQTKKGVSSWCNG